MMSTGVFSIEDIARMIKNKLIEPSEVDTDIVLIAEELGIPKYDSLIDAPDKKGSVIYLTEEEEESVSGIYKHDGISYSLLTDKTYVDLKINLSPYLTDETEIDEEGLIKEGHIFKHDAVFEPEKVIFVVEGQADEGETLEITIDVFGGTESETEILEFTDDEDFEVKTFEIDISEWENMAYKMEVTSDGDGTQRILEVYLQ